MRMGVSSIQGGERNPVFPLALTLYGVLWFSHVLGLWGEMRGPLFDINRRESLIIWTETGLYSNS